MDGVIYRENQLIPGAGEFVEALIATGSPFLFLTNNSAPTPQDLAVRLKHLGIHGLAAKHFYTSALNTADFLCDTDPGCTVFAIGEGGLLAALHERLMRVGSPCPMLYAPVFLRRSRESVRRQRRESDESRCHRPSRISRSCCTP